MIVLQIILWSGVFLISIFLLVKSSDWFIDAAKAIGTYFRWPEFVIGVIIVGIGTSLPELASSMAAVLGGKSEIVVANVFGSNITNITLVFGISAFAGKSFKIKHDIMKTDLPFLVASSVLIALMISDGRFSFPEAALCTAAMVIYVWRALKSGEVQIDENTPPREKLGVMPWIMLIISPVLISVGAKFTVDSVVKISEILRIGTDVIAVTAVALGTSLPEVMVSIQAARKGNAEIAVGNVIGSNIFNALAVMGIPGMVGSLVIPASMLAFVLPMFIGSTALMTLIVLDKRVFRFEGFILLLMYLYFVGHTFGGF